MENAGLVVPVVPSSIAFEPNPAPYLGFAAVLQTANRQRSTLEPSQAVLLPEKPAHYAHYAHYFNPKKIRVVRERGIV
jgi:hypothetical protein